MKKKKKSQIDLEEKIIFNSFKFMSKIKTKKNKRKKNNIRSLYFRYLVISIVLLFIIIFLYSLVKKFYFNYGYSIPKDNDQIIKPYIIEQKDFCENYNKYKNEEYERNLFLASAKINELNFQFYIYKGIGFIRGSLEKKGAFEVNITKNIIEALKFYSLKKNIKNNKDIFMLDIGTNIGWYPAVLGRYGYTILCFEAFEKNNYVAKKNYCYLNKDSNVILITKGLGSEEKKCQYFTHLNSGGNGMVICQNNATIKDISTSRNFIKDGEVEITTLNIFMPYLLNKNIALMKLDIEGHELKALIGGKQLITKYHIPFVVLEFSPNFIQEVGSNPKELVQLFVDNGYKISLEGFLSKDFINADELLKKAISNQINCYFIHESMIKLL